MYRAEPRPSIGFGDVTISARHRRSSLYCPCECLMSNQFERTLLQVAPESVLSGLPQHLRDIPARVEAATGIAVQVLPYGDEPPARSIGNPKMRAMLDIDANTQSVTIWCTPGEVTSLMIGHQLIALRRYVLESVPRFVAVRNSGPKTKADLQAMENELELLFLIPEEVKAFAGAMDFWVGEFYKMIPVAQGMKSDFYLAMMWAQVRTSLPTQSLLADTIERLLKSIGDTSVALAHDIRHMYRLALPDKAALLADMTTAMTPDFMSQFSTACFIVKDGALKSQQVDLSGVSAEPELKLSVVTG